MNIALSNTLDAIRSEAPHFKISFRLVDEILDLYGESDLADRLFADIEASIDWRVVADLFGILIWSTSDNGHALTEVTERWLIECDDERKVNIALSLDVYPFREMADMRRYLAVVAIKFPSASEMCDALIQSRLNERES